MSQTKFSLFFLFQTLLVLNHGPLSSVDSFLLIPPAQHQTSTTPTPTTKATPRATTTKLYQEQSSLWNHDHNLVLSRRQVWKRTAAGAAAAALPPYSTSTAAYSSDETTSRATSTTLVPTVQLGNGSLSISKTIQGYWQLAGGHGRYQESDALANMKAHFDAGITTLDTADIYGPSELIVGKFVASSQQAGRVAIPITKFCCFRFLDEIDRNEVKTRIQRACERLQVAKLPLVQFFWSNYDVKRYVDVALYLTELKEQGLIQEIGATNFDLKRLQEMKAADVPLVSHQVQLSALDRRPIQSGMADWCVDNNISLVAFGTVGSGILSEQCLGRPQPLSLEEKTTASLRMYSATASRFGDWKLVQELLQTMDRVAANVRADGRCHGCRIANVAQRYVLQSSPAVAAVLIGVRNSNHIQENVLTHSFQLSQDEFDSIEKVVTKRKGPRGDVWDIERGYA